MFGSQEELTKPLQTKMTINIVGNNYLNEALISTCLDITEGEYTDKIRVINFSNIDEMISSSKVKIEKSDETQIFGLLNLNWIKRISLLRPATIVLVYDVKAKSENISWREYENSIFIDINKCKKIEKNEFLNIVVLIITSSNSFTFESVNDEKDKIYSIKKVLEPKNLIYINGLESLKNNSKKLSTHLINITVNYYRQIKKKYKIALSEKKEFKEFVIKTNIKLGIISQIKNKKRNFKYFESALANLIDLSENIKKYQYGIDLKMNYFEIKAVADWLYFKSLQIKLAENKSLISVINSFSIHIQFFSRIDLLMGNNLDQKENIFLQNIDMNKNFDLYLIVEYFWKIIRYEGFAKLLEENIGSLKDDFFAKNNWNFPGYYNMLASFEIKRLQKVLETINPKLSEYQPFYSLNSKIFFRESKFYGRQYRIYEQIDPLTERTVDFDKIYYIKNFISLNSLNRSTLSKRLVDNLYKAEKLYKKYLINYPENSDSTLTLYFNILSMVNIDDFKVLDKHEEIAYTANSDVYNPTDLKKENLEKLKCMFKSFIFNSTLYKFKDLYIKFLNNYNEILKLDGILNNHKDNCEEILLNFFNLSAVRTLTQNEQEFLHKIISDENYYNPEKPIKHKFSLKKKNSILKFDYTLSNHTPKIFDIFEYNYYFTSELEQELKLKSISIIYNNQDRNKNYFDVTYELSKSKPLNLKNVFQVKESDNNLTLKAIRCELQTDNKNVIYLEMHVKNDSHKIILVKQMEIPVIEFKYRKHIQIGLEQFYKCEIEITRKDKNVNIENLNLNFRISDKEMKDHFSKTNILGLNSLKNSNQRSSNISQNLREEFSSRKTSKDDIYGSLYDSSINMIENLNFINHELIVRDHASFDDINNNQNKEFLILKNNFNFNFKSIEEKEKCEFLIKINDKGNFYIFLDADYKIIKKEILDDFSLMKYTGEINVEVINAFTPQFEIFSPSYMSLQKIKIFPTNKKIKINLNITNEIKEDFKIRKINLISKIPEITLKSLLPDLFNFNKNLNNNLVNSTQKNILEIFNFKKCTDYSIPLSFICSQPYSGSLGNIEIFFSTSGLEDFNIDLENRVTFNIPEYNLKNFDIDLGYSIPKGIKSKEHFELEIHIKNRSEENKRLLLLIDSTQYFIVNGRVKERIMLGEKENVERKFNLSPLNFGKLKLPAFKIMEFPYESNNYENKIYSIYYLPDNIHIN